MNIFEKKSTMVHIVFKQLISSEVPYRIATNKQDLKLISSLRVCLCSYFSSMRYPRARQHSTAKSQSKFLITTCSITRNRVAPFLFFVLPSTTQCVTSVHPAFCCDFHFSAALKFGQHTADISQNGS